MTQPPTIEVHDSPGLVGLFDDLSRGQPIGILDLGPALRRNFEFYSDRAARVRFADLLPADATEHAADRRAPRPQSGAPLFDLILTWGVYNYLGPDEAGRLSRQLADLAAPGASLHTMIFASETIPERSFRYEISNDRRLAYVSTTDRVIAAPNPPPAMVERWLQPFRVKHSVVLRHGVREFVAVLD